jgi:integrase
MSNPKATKLPSGRWRARAYDYTDRNGKRHYVSFTAEKKIEAQAAARAHIPSGGRRDIPYPEITLSEAYKRYIDTRTDTLAPSTIREYTNARNRDFPNLMPMKLKDITAELVQTAVNEAAKKYSPKTVRDKHGLLHKVLRLYAPGINLKTDLPKKKQIEVYIPTTDEVARALETADETLRVPILLASRGSLRRSEICALTHADFTDFGVNVNKAIVKNKDNKWVIKQPKSRAGYRFCPLPPDVIKEARAYDFSKINPDRIEGYWQRLKSKQGLPFKFHAFRHYWASLLHAKGMPDQYIAQIGGWSSIEMLHRVYAHALRDKTPAFNNQVVDIFKNEFSQEEKKKA